MSDQDKPTQAPHTSTAAFVAQLVAEHFNDKTTGSAEITSTWDGHAGTLTIEIKPTAPADDFERLSRNMRDTEAWRAAGCPPGLITGMGDHVVLATIDTTQPTAPENIFMPTENPDGTWTTKIPRHPPTGTVDAMALAVQHARANPGATSADHPGPWTWNWRQDAGQPAPYPDGWVTDANGPTVLSAARPASTLAREMIRLAPEMEQALRDLKDVFDTAKASVARGDWRTTDTERRVVSLLAALDAARKATV